MSETNRTIKRIPKAEVERRNNIKRRAEICLMEVYVYEMAAKYPDHFKKIVEKTIDKKFVIA